jgi:long-chain acyl-CoA synthetase
MPQTHLTKMILNRCAQYGSRPALYYKQNEAWKTVTWETMAQQITGLAKALLSRGLAVQDRVAIYAPNRPEWTISDYAIMGVRGITTTIYATNSAAEAEYIVNDAQANILFVGGQEQYDRAMDFFSTSSCLKTMVVFDESVSLEKTGDIYAHPFPAMVDEFITCIQEQRESPHNLASAVNAHEACFAITKSAERGGEEIAIQSPR